ncbi:extracellular solute-binding protein [Roseomonas alkaliterrae]|uniref:Iron(III) transport system substrate-binding protein n=1 Tax=Neoroseomonas alkaliterrae TaxID=1452450 RepID=A0A840Y4P5_9PROT|nr:extracellular solute-binding protein [Neoroseomonas alkaliterrae]MBB5689113.1 iron(III) transport system substrate-binding protein [Neoroseomonas alkaliterrae]MBR0675274.1 extracellular solute-binding protein [Neoroseomonas alkaliterrae]
MRRRQLLAVPALAAAGALARPALAQERTLNLYSSRHYDTDRALYDGFTAETGMRIRLIEGDADQLIARIQSEGANTPADVLITVDGARLARASAANILAPTRSEILNGRVPASLRHPEGEWYGVSRRARVIMFDKTKGRPAGLDRYEDLARPEFRGQILVRAAAHPYNTSLMASIMVANGEQAAEAWARGVAQNMARPPQGGDTPQFQAVAAGVGGLAIANTYYLARFGASSNAEQRALYDRIGVIFPNQAEGDRGAHVNVSGAGVVRSSSNREMALKFIEYLTGPRAQEMFANGNFEYPVVADVPPHPALAALGTFRADELNAQRYGALAPQALQIMQRAGWR